MNELEYIEDSYEISEVTKGKILNKYIEQNLENKIENYEQIVDSALNTISQFTLIKGEEIKNVKVGLAFGKVQSGKTTYFLCASACALDNGFDIIIILSGVTKNLLTQNKKRLKKSFRECKTFLQFYDSTDFKDRVNTVIDDIKDDFNSYAYSNINGGVFISVLKEDSHLRKINQIVTEFKDKRILIIDDEGDQFTMNTKINKAMESTIFSYIRSILEISDNVSLLSVTATPQANIFIDIFDELSPDFIEIVEPGQDYCGLETFHSNNDYISFVSGDKREFSEDLSKSIIYYLFTIYETEFNNPSKYNNTKNWMLVHTSRLKTIHLNDFEELNDILSLELKPLSLEKKFDFLDIHKNKTLSKIKSVFNEFKILEKFNFSLEEFLQKFELVLNLIYTDYDNYNIKIINSDESEIDSEDELQTTKYGILIGGDMLGRGITIEGLTVSFLTRDTISGKGNIDTILQRARWFGYRRNVLNLVKIFTTEEIQSKMIEIYHHDVALYEQIKYCVENNIPIKDNKIPVPVPKKLDITRKNVIKKGSIKRNTSTSFLQQRKVLCSIDYSIHDMVNRSVISVLNRSKYTTCLKDIKEYNLLSQDLLDSLKQYFEHSSAYSLNWRLYESVKKILKDNETISVYVIKDYEEESKGYTLTKDTSNYKSTDDVYVGNVLSGASSEYKGDLYHFNEKNHIQLHFTRIKDEKYTDIYSGKKVLFLCVNNKSINPTDYVQRR